MNCLPVEVTGISVSAANKAYMLVLRESGGVRWLPIYIGAPEAQTISILLDGLKTARPLTYDMFYSILKDAPVTIERVIVTALTDSTFFAEVNCLRGDGTRFVTDARPSDAIALALKTQAPILVNSEVLDSAGMVGEVVVTATKQAMDKETKLKLLNEKLQMAVAREDYESAARLRDLINDLQKQDPVG